MKKLPEHPAWLEFDAFSETDGISSRAFAKMAKAAQGYAHEAAAWQSAFEREFIAHHRKGKVLSHPCAAAERKMPKYRKSRSI